MNIVITRERSWMQEAHVFDELAVHTSLCPRELITALRRAGLGELAADDRHVWLNLSSLLRLSPLTADEQWVARFSSMVTYATSKGWIDDHGRLRAHVEITGVAQ